ncbi:MAG: 2-oxo acid dehydrogenase subunit E2 [Gemmatimonadetes bacterium]|nr:2-oxo acid dehydrogenase subunit E2 [Gemmatimonadota bacterium]
MARIDVLMPQMGESIAEGTLSKWLKKVGDPVKRDEPIFEISTDKVDAEIPAPTAGVLAEILVTEGQTVPVQTLVARIETEAGAAVAAPAAPAPPPAPAPAPAPKPVPTAAPASAAPVVAPPASRPASEPTGDESLEDRLRRKSTPVVRRMVAEHGLDLAAIPGTGMAGRVTKHDVISYLEQAPAPASPAPARPSPAASPTPASIPIGGGVQVIPGPVVEPWEGDKVEPWSRIRKLTADHMIMSRRVSPHVSSLIEIDYTRVAQLRAKRKAEFADRGVNLTFLAFVAKSVAGALRNHPVVNAAVMGEATLLRREINLGIAVALDWGLIVPVIRRADELSLIGVARAIQDLADRARSKKLTPDEVQKGTFTITNPGVFGTMVGLPIINQPQAAILAVGAIEKQPAVVAQPDGTDAIGIRTKGILAMSFDHRIVDGADADRFLAEVRRGLHEFADNA